MKMIFYDVKTRKKVEAVILEKKEYLVNSLIRYAVKAKTDDGRWLTRFVSKSDYDDLRV